LSGGGFDQIPESATAQLAQVLSDQLEPEKEKSQPEDEAVQGGHGRILARTPRVLQERSGRRNDKPGNMDFSGVVQYNYNPAVSQTVSNSLSKTLNVTRQGRI